MSESRSPRRVAYSTLAAVTVAGLTLSVVQPSQAADSSPARDRAAAASPAVRSAGAKETKGFYDARDVGRPGTVAVATKALRGAAPPAQVGKLRKMLGSSAVVDIDPLTGTPANLTALDRYLTGPRASSARSTALSYVRAHLSELGLRSSDLSTLRLSRDYVDESGTDHLAWTQWADGVEVFGNGLKAHVTKRGQLISIQGSPVSGLAGLTAGRSATPQLGATTARGKAAADVGSSAEGASLRTSSSRTGSTSLWSNGDSARPVWFISPSGAHLAWDTFTKTSDGQAYSHVVDATNGSVLYRRDLIDNDRGDARVYEYFPGAARGGKPKVVNFVKRKWIAPRASWLQGRNVSAWADLNDDNLVNPREKTPLPGTKAFAQFKLHHFNGANKLCSKKWVCTWSPNRRFSWRVNKRADVTNAFFLASNRIESQP